MFFLFLISVMLKKIPTHIPTQLMSIEFKMAGTCSARTCKSGSETVIKKPRTPHIIKGIKILLFLFKDLYIPSPKGSIDIPEPIVKKLIPIISIIVPNKNKTSTPASRDTQVTERIRTITAIGKTEVKDSFAEQKYVSCYNTPIVILL